MVQRATILVAVRTPNHPASHKNFTQDSLPPNYLRILKSLILLIHSQLSSKRFYPICVRIFWWNTLCFTQMILKFWSRAVVRFFITRFSHLELPFNFMLKVKLAGLNATRVDGPRVLPLLQTTNCSVQRAGVFSEINNRSEDLERRLTSGAAQMTSAKIAITKLASLSHLVRSPSLEDLARASRFTMNWLDVMGTPWMPQFLIFQTLSPYKSSKSQ